MYSSVLGVFQDGFGVGLASSVKWLRVHQVSPRWLKLWKSPALSLGLPIHCLKILGRGLSSSFILYSAAASD
jgi:hypothetical protein